MLKITRLRQALVLLPMLLGSGWASGALLNPGSSYLSFRDSPFWSSYQAGDFNGTGGYFFLENFEDGTLNTPGVQLGANSTPNVVLSPQTLTDSVDADRVGNTTNWQTGSLSAVNGIGNDGHSLLFNPSGGIARATFIFNPGGTLNMLPTHVGMVWTDGRDGNRNPAPVILEAFDANGISLGTINKNGLADNAHEGQVAEDRFLGAVNQGNGISRITITTTTGGMELDHLQYGYLASTIPSPPPAIPEPSTLLLMALILLGLPLIQGRRMT